MEHIERVFSECLSAMAQSNVWYPDGNVHAPFMDWIEADAQDAMDMGISLEGGEWHGYSDIAIMQKEWYVEELIKVPFGNALKVLAEQGCLSEEGMKLLSVPTARPSQPQKGEK